MLDRAEARLRRVAAVLVASLWLAGVGVLPPARGDWHVVTVDSAGTVGDFPSLAVDGNGDSHVAYIDQTLRCLKYAKRVGGVWQTEIADTRYPYYPSLALDAQGRPHMAWSGLDGLWYSRWTGTQWHSELACPWGRVGEVFIPALALTSDDVPCIAYYVPGSEGCQLGYATRTGPTWVTTVIAPHGGSGSRPALVLDANDNPRIAWAWEWSMGCALTYYSFDGGVWSNEYVTEVAFCATACAAPLVLDSYGNPHVVCATVYGDRMWHMWRSTAGWESEDIILGDVVSAPSLALDAFDRPHVAYYRWYGDRLKYAHRTTSAWCIQTVDDSGPDDVGYTPSIAVDPDGDPHIAYVDRTNLDLKYAWWEPSVVTGDLNCDGCVGFGDINPFVQFLSNFSAWQATYPGCNPLNGDINGDGVYGEGSFGDINPFVALLAGG
jgi:hypothetical protein